MKREGCIDCGSDDLEYFEDMDGGYYDVRCVSCNSRLIDRANKRREWNYYHPGEPCPESELE